MPHHHTPDGPINGLAIRLYQQAEARIGIAPEQGEDFVVSGNCHDG